jgi:ABC-type uncharacterized transport system fused permease/ATPase subunit
LQSCSLLSIITCINHARYRQSLRTFAFANSPDQRIAESVEEFASGMQRAAFGGILQSDKQASIGNNVVLFVFSVLLLLQTNVPIMAIVFGIAYALVCGVATLIAAGPVSRAQFAQVCSVCFSLRPFALLCI